MPDRMLITGGTGLLGADLAVFFSSRYKVFSAGSKDFDIRDIDQIRRSFNDFQPDYVLHAAAIADVDKCEKDKRAAMEINAVGTGNIARACRECEVFLVYYSTDYVFDGTKGSPYIERDTPNPVNYYGLSKWEGEKRLSDLSDHAVILRIAWLYGNSEKSFIRRLIERGNRQIRDRINGEKMEQIKVVTDQIGTPTYTMDVARQTEAILRSRLKGLFHCTAEGHASRLDLAEYLYEKLNMEVELTSCRREDFEWKAPRPENTSLENLGLKNNGINVMPEFRAAIDSYLKEWENNDNS